MLGSKSCTNDQLTRPCDTRICGIVSGHPSYIVNVSKHQTIFLKYILKSKSGMNDHPTRPLDTKICRVNFWATQLCFYAFKTPNYTPQKEVKK